MVDTADFLDDKRKRDDAMPGRIVPAFVYKLPWWLITLILIGLFALILILTDETFGRIFEQLREGIAMTLGVSVIAYISALIVGLVVGLIRSRPPQVPEPGTPPLRQLRSLAHTFLYNILTLYVEMLRGLPVLVVLLIVAFVLVPEIKNVLNASFGIELQFRGSSPTSAVIALAFTYGAFISETFRAGIQSIERGQIDAALSVGMTRVQAMRYVILPQAVRRILPPLGNDMVAMVKDSSLVAILGVRDITQVAKTASGRSFLYMETYLMVAVIYLTMTIIGSLFVKWIERRMKQTEF
ncbi:MAG: amino acid ABC transporter permease [Aggregatilineales bacterium]